MCVCVCALLHALVSSDSGPAHPCCRDSTVSKPLLLVKHCTPSRRDEIVSFGAERYQCNCHHKHYQPESFIFSQSIMSCNLVPDRYRDKLQANQFGNSLLFPYRRLGKTRTTNYSAEIPWEFIWSDLTRQLPGNILGE